MEDNNFTKDLLKVVSTIPSLCEDSENATIIITWLLKMANKLKENQEKLEALKSSLDKD